MPQTPQQLKRAFGIEAKSKRAKREVAGVVTRGTTNTNRLRRVDRWITTLPAFTRAADPFIVDLGFGSSSVTTRELWARLKEIRSDVTVVGVEIDPSRVESALAEVSRLGLGDDPSIGFIRGGFDLPTVRRANVIRAFNVLRQYDETDVVLAWNLMCSRLEPEGAIVEGTCDEIGRVSTWITLDNSGPQIFTISLRLEELELPSIAAERLPKILIHRNLPGEPVHSLLSDLDHAWRVNATHSVFGARQRWIMSVAMLRKQGWPILGNDRRARLGELSVPWDAIAPKDPREISGRS